MKKAGALAISDLSIELLDDDYPPVTSVYFEDEGKEKQFDWSEVESFDLGSGRIVVDDLESATVSPETDDKVRLRRDILDSLVLDLLGRRTTRVCDLLLQTNDGEFRPKGADVGL